MAAVTGNFTNTVANVLQASALSTERQEAIYQGFLGNQQVVPEQFRNDWQDLLKLCGEREEPFAEKARLVPVAWNVEEEALETQALVGVEKGMHEYLSEVSELGGEEAAWAYSILSIKDSQTGWLDRRVKGCVLAMLRPEIDVSSDLMQRLAAKIVAVLSQEFEGLEKLLKKITTFDENVTSAFTGAVTVSAEALKSFKAQASAIEEGDYRLLEVSDTALISRYEDLIYPDLRAAAASVLRDHLWVNAPRVQLERERPITALYEECANYVSAKAGEVLNSARGFGIEPSEEE